MPIPTLPQPEHEQMALELLDDADLEFAAANMLKGSEMLWGAAAHALIALALQTRRPYDSHGAMRDAAKQLANVRNRPHWLTDFDLADDCHRNFYHGHLTNAEVMRNRQRVRRMVTGLLDVLEQARRRG